MSSSINIYEKLNKIQSELKAPKSNYNSFGKYHYRSCEDIMEGLKPLLTDHNVTLVVNDEIVQVGDRYYIKSTATLVDTESEKFVQASAYAREEESKKGMDSSQLTGSTSSYARKYALNGLFCIDDTKDADATNAHGKEKPEKKQPKAAPQPTLKETMFYNLKQIGVTDKEKIVEYIKSRIGKEISSSDELTEAEIKKVAEDAKKMKESV